jgi:Ca2+-binding EF-hand superfamily protein
MKRMSLAALAATLLIAGGAALAPPAFAAPTDQEVQNMLKQGGMTPTSGMVSKQDFMKMMEKRFDTMDKQKKGMISTADIAKILDPNFNSN